MCVCVSYRSVLKTNQMFFFFFNQKSFDRFCTDIIVFETKQIPQMFRSRLKLCTVCTGFVREKKKSCIWKEKLSDATFVRLGRRNYVISVCALSFRAACNNDIVNDCLAWLSSSNMISIIMMCWCIIIIMKTNVNTCCTLGKVYTRSVLWPII